MRTERAAQALADQKERIVAHKRAARRAAKRALARKITVRGREQTVAEWRASR